MDKTMKPIMETEQWARRPAFREYVKTVEEKNNVTITGINRVALDGTRNGDNFRVIVGVDYDLLNCDTVFYTGKPFTEKEIERFRNLIATFVSLELELLEEKILRSNPA